MATTAEFYSSSILAATTAMSCLCGRCKVAKSSPFPARAATLPQAAKVASFGEGRTQEEPACDLGSMCFGFSKVLCSSPCVEGWGKRGKRKVREGGEDWRASAPGNKAHRLEGHPMPGPAPGSCSLGSRGPQSLGPVAARPTQTSLCFHLPEVSESPASWPVGLGLGLKPSTGLAGQV